jgi:hypothetical protein
MICGRDRPQCRRGTAVELGGRGGEDVWASNWRHSRDGPGTLAEASIAPVSRCRVREIERFGMSPVDHSGVLSRWGLVSVHRPWWCSAYPRIHKERRASVRASFKFGQTVQPCLCWHLEAGSILVIWVDDTLTRNAHIGHRTSLGVIWLDLFTITVRGPRHTDKART